MGIQASKIQLDITLADGSTALGKLILEKGRIGAKLETGEILLGTDGCIARFLKNKNPEDWLHNLIQQETSFELASQSEAIGYYSRDDIRDDDLFPRSSGGWVRRLASTGLQARYSIHQIPNSSRLLLIIAGIDSDEVFEAVRIREYETGLVTLVNDYDYSSLDMKKRSVKTKLTPERLLAGKSPPIDRFEILASQPGVERFNYVADSLDETVDSLVPTSYPEHVRQQIKAFFAYVVKKGIPNGDPLDEVFFVSHRLLHSLIRMHILCLLENAKPPNYVGIMNMAALGSLPSRYDTVLAGEVEPPPWQKGLWMLIDEIPLGYNRILMQIRNLEESSTIPSGMPVTREMAAKSIDAWKDRFLIITKGLNMRGRVNHEKIGLKYVLYLGSAYRWPHNHTAWSAQFLRGKEANPLFLQVMVMPPSAVAKANRTDEESVMERTLTIDWSSSLFMNSLFDEEKGRWRFSTDKVVNSLASSVTNRKLENSLNIPKKDVIRRSRLDADIMSRVSRGMYLDNLEVGLYNQELGIDKSTLVNRIQEMKDKRILDIQYSGRFPGLYSLGIRLRYNQKGINSFVKTITSQAASSTVFMDKQTEECILIARIPRSKVTELSQKLPLVAKDNDINLSVHPVTRYAAYLNNLYSRLWQGEKDWDSDIGSFISQGRL